MFSSNYQNIIDKIKKEMKNYWLDYLIASLTNKQKDDVDPLTSFLQGADL